MPANNLTGSSLSSTYTQLLHCGTGTLAAGFTVRLGDGTASPLTISSTGISAPTVSATTSISAPTVSATTSISAPTVSATTSISAPSAQFNGSSTSNKISITNFGLNKGYGMVFINGTTTSTFPAVFFASNSTSLIGSIGTSETGVQLNTTSDGRLKEDIKPITNGVERIKKLKPVDFKWKADGSFDDGFIAQDLLEMPEFARRVSMTPGADGMYSVDYTRFAATLVAAIQEQQAAITALEARLDALS